MKNNILFYQHYVNSSDHPKFKTLRVKYGWAGEGKFWALNNKIADAENCELNLSKKYNKASIANDLNFSIEEFDGFLEYLEEDCDLIIRENNHITTKILRENLEKVMKERKRNKNNYNKRVIQNVNEDKTQSKPIESEIKPVENIQSKVKESKVKESKGKPNININIEFEKFWELYDKKISKLKTEPLWNKLSNIDRKSIMDYIPKYKESQSDKFYRKNPDVFLRNKAWEDEIVIKQQTKGLGSTRHTVNDKTQYKDL